MQITLHQTHQQVADFSSIFEYLTNAYENAQTGIHVFPELFLTGYPLQDICLQKSFIQTYLQLLEKINNWAKENFKREDVVFLLGGIDYQLTNENLPLDLRNVVFKLEMQGPLTPIYTKQLLPNYDIFDEQKYFTKGNTNGVLNWKGKNIGILICEDMWVSSFHHIDPVELLHKEVSEKEISLDCIVNLSASPYVVNKPQKRADRSMYIAKYFKCPYVYVNRVGGEDEILFDGRSFICDGNQLLTQAKSFNEDCITYKIEDDNNFEGDLTFQKEYTWESLFSARIENTSELPLLTKWSDEQCEDVLEALKFGVQEYATKSGFNKFTIALSGGIDSALVLTILRLSLKPNQTLEAIYMPSIYSSPLSYELSLELCKNLGVPMKSMPIKFLHSAAKNLFSSTFSENFEGLTDENIQSRIRGMLIYTRSNQINSMVINTSNKSELAVGYSTQYGDSVGAISIIGDLYKSEVYRLSDYINEKYSNLIPEKIISREPSAELRPDQTDAQSLPPYERLDAMLEGILSYRYSKNDLIKKGFDQTEVEKVFNLYRKSEYKRYQFCPIVKISSKSFGFGYRIPTSKSSSFYTQDLN